MLCIALHAWIGIWCVLTDYVTVRLIGLKADIIRTTLQYALGGVTAAYLLWTVKILWGI
jgi:succinate dehydrogenase / fumarate reductase membrane anchor subunit